MTRIYIRHNRRRYVVEIEGRKVTVRRRGLLFSSSTSEDRDAVARVLAQALADLWPTALEHSVMASLR